MHTVLKMSPISTPYCHRWSRLLHTQYPLSTLPPQVCNTETQRAVRLSPTLSRFSPHITLTASIRSFTPIKAFGDGSFSTVWLCDWRSPLPPNTPISTMQSIVGTRPEYANRRLVAVKRMRRRWELGWDECRKLKELEVRAHPLFLGSPFPNYLRLASQIRHYLQYPLIQTSYPCTTLFFFQRPRNSTLCSSQWKGIYISSSSPAMVVAPLQVVSSHLFSDRLSRAYITSMPLVTFIGI